jgi:hypothetical protein
MNDSQTIITTHSGDFLKGVLDAGDTKTRVLRLIRDGDLNRITELKSDEIQELWKDPLLRYSNVLDGLFHEAVILCESDSDCVLYGAVLDEICKTEPKRRPDILFLHCGGKSRMTVVIRALIRMGVPISTIVDFDVLNEQTTLQSIVEAHSGDWGEVKQLWKSVHNAINSRRPDLSTEEIKKEILRILDGIGELVFPKSANKDIHSILRKSTPWQHAKGSGLRFLKGEEFRNGERLLSLLSKLHIHVVPVGELECFFPAAGGHGPAFAAEVFTRNLIFTEASAEIKSFVKTVVFPS